MGGDNHKTAKELEVRPAGPGANKMRCAPSQLGMRLKRAMMISSPQFAFWLT